MAVQLPLSFFLLKQNVIGNISKHSISRPLVFAGQLFQMALSLGKPTHKTTPIKPHPLNFVVLVSVHMVLLSQGFCTRPLHLWAIVLITMGTTRSHHFGRAVTSLLTEDTAMLVSHSQPLPVTSHPLIPLHCRHLLTHHTHLYTPLQGQELPGSKGH